MEQPRISKPYASGTGSATSSPSLFNIGSSDLDPFYPAAFGPGGGSGQLLPPAHSGGMLMGPGHPMFAGGSCEEGWRGGKEDRVGIAGDYFDPANPSLFPRLGVRPPRYDPIMPVGGPMGPNFGGASSPGRGLVPGIGLFNGGPGRGRGTRPVALPGEPNPDHLRPPADDNMYM